MQGMRIQMSVVEEVEKRRSNSSEKRQVGGSFSNHVGHYFPLLTSAPIVFTDRSMLHIPSAGLIRFSIPARCGES